MAKIEIKYQNSGTPSSSFGNNDETYLNTDTNELFVKENNFWRSLGKRRGRKPGTKAQKSIYFVCVGYTSINEINIEDSEGFSDDDLKNQAIKQFVDNTNEEPSFVFGPFYKRKSSISEKKSSNNLDLNSVSFKDDKLSAIFEDWIVSVKLLEEHDDSAFVIFKSNIDENSKKTKPFPKIVKIKNLKDLTAKN
jgi:hypothetical protein